MERRSLIQRRSNWLPARSDNSALAAATDLSTARLSTARQLAAHRYPFASCKLRGSSCVHVILCSFAAGRKTHNDSWSVRHAADSLDVPCMAAALSTAAFIVAWPGPARQIRYNGRMTEDMRRDWIPYAVAAAAVFGCLVCGLADERGASGRL
jgi:hypothetical protein